MDSTLAITLRMVQEGMLDIKKAAATFVQPNGQATAGLQAYNLEEVKEFIPITTPLLKSTPRVGGGFGQQANWKVFRGFNSGAITAGTPEGSRNEPIDASLQERFAVWRTLTMEGRSTLQAGLAAQGFDDPRARARRYATNAQFLEQEWMMLGGNGSATGISLGTVT